jgi:hypothetical protein
MAISPVARDASSRLRIVVLGYIVRGPIGGMAWHHLQYVVGLARLGHDVLFLEESEDFPSCYNPVTNEVGSNPSYGLQFAQSAFERLGVGECWSFYDAPQQTWHGPAADRVLRSCGVADLLINISGVNPIRPWLAKIPVRVLIDTDPAFTQIRHITSNPARSRAAQHNAFFSFAESIESGESTIPDDGFPWQATRQPVVLDLWPVSDGPTSAPFTTVMQWESYPAIEFDGRRFGMKSESFDIIRQLPGRVAVPLEIALGCREGSIRRDLRELGWRLVDPLAVTRDPWTYQEYLQNSLGEFSVAKHGYVVSRSGWFSEKTACYLATGRPAVVQDTGFSRHITCGAGLWAFHDAESAIDAIENVEKNYQKECRIAREIADEYFNSQKVLNSILDRAFACANSPARKE